MNTEDKMFIRPAYAMSEGDGVDVNRLFPIHGKMMNFDPFVLWDNFNLEPGRGFPTHPHRGFEAITYMFSGSMEHKDNLGNASTVTAGGAQRFTAGRGLEHSEMPGGDGYNSGIQLWINLPQRQKGIDPEYQQVDAESFPVKTLDGVTVKTIVGVDSPLLIKTPFQYLHINMENETNLQQEVPKNFHGFIYLLKGNINVNGQQLNEVHALFFSESDKLSITANEQSEFMLCMGQPHNEPIRQYGPFVD